MLRKNEIDKAAFCEKLHALSQETNSGEDSNEAGFTLEDAKKTKSSSAKLRGQNESRFLGDEANRSTVNRAATYPTPTSHQLKSTRITTAVALEGSASQETPLQSSQHGKRALQRTVSAPIPSVGLKHGKVEKSALGKRKRKEAPIKLMPESRQIFKGCTFFFIPNDDIAPLRRARIRKVREYGANRSLVLNAEVTHMIIDTGLSYQDVISFLKILCIPAEITMVVDTYPVDCIQFRAILDSTQRRYQVKGSKFALDEGPARLTTPRTSDNPLDIKPAQSKPGKWDYVPIRTTPPRSEEPTETESILENSAQLHGKSTPESETTEPHEGRNDRSKEVRLKSVLNQPCLEISSDELDEMIKEARTLKDLPLDEYEDDRPLSLDCAEENDSGDASDSPSPTKKPPSFSKTVKKGGLREENFSCMKGGTAKTSGSDSSPNARTISVLQEMADYYTRIHDTWRPMAYRKAISTLRQQRNKIISAQEASKLPFVGQRLALKIEEIAKTDCLRRLENVKAEPSDHILQKFMGIYGVGFSLANKWLQSGYSTLEDLKAKAQLSENQLLGIEHYDDLQTRIPREEVTALGAVVRKAAAKIDAKVEIIIGGSYRRGAATSGDIDCIITKPNTTNSKDIFPFLGELVSQLEAVDFLVAALAVPRAESGTKWHGCCVLPGSPKPIWRRIDFLLVPASELGAALLYFTGNDIFNRSIRLLASRKGMRLNQRGLYKDVMRGPGRVKMTDGEVVEGSNEKRIFAALSVPWRPPEQRIC